MPMTGTDFARWRAHTGVSKTQVAQWLGVSPRTITNYENSTAPLPQTIALACAALSVGFRDYSGVSPIEEPQP